MTISHIVASLAVHKMVTIMIKSKRKIIIISAVLLLGICLGGYFIFRPNVVESIPGEIGPGYVLYSVGTKITFNRGGNSADYTLRHPGWGGQEPEHRCIVGNVAELKLFVSDADGRDLRIKVDGFGVFAPDEKCQNITVYANDTLIDKWCMRRPDIYTATIPASVMPNGALHIRFDVEKPYVSEVDVRALGAAVRGVSIHALNGQQTKKQLSRWIQKKIWGDRAKNPYNEEQESAGETDKKKSV